MPTKNTVASKPAPIELVSQRISIIRGQKILLDSDLAQLYGVETRRLNEQVRRNPEALVANADGGSRGGPLG
jgi:hypothetical protein